MDANSICYVMQVAFAFVACATLRRMRKMTDPQVRIERLKAAIDRLCEGNANEFGRRLGYKDGTFIRQMLNGSRPVTEKTITAVEGLPGLRGWFGAGLFDANISPAPIGARSVPLINYVQAGELTAIGAAFTGEAMEFLLTDLELSDHSFALEIKGLSMTPDFNPGDRVIVDQEVAPMAGDFVVAKNGSDEATFKKYRPRGINQSGNDIFELVPLNDDFPTLYSDREPLQIIATMVEHRRYRRR